MGRDDWGQFWCVFHCSTMAILCFAPNHQVMKEHINVMLPEGIIEPSPPGSWGWLAGWIHCIVPTFPSLLNPLRAKESSLHRHLSFKLPLRAWNSIRHAYSSLDIQISPGHSSSTGMAMMLTRELSWSNRQEMGQRKSCSLPAISSKESKENLLYCFNPSISLPSWRTRSTESINSLISSSSATPIVPWGPLGLHGWFRSNLI